ncbi:MAG TPA: hypothetical protein VEO94_06895, partial [Candidatus Dormibacteraeota bacterium]|nr:hypothetical protein [Candidatus Dormibacteraeota bacterium]
ATPRASRLLSILSVAASLSGARPAGAADTGAQGAYVEMVAVVHLHTSLGDGLATPLELARSARSRGIDALVITDHLIERVAYAPWPIGNVLGVSVSRRSVVSTGIARYFAVLGRAENDTGILVLPGLEVSPYARWTGWILDRTLELQGWHRHVLVIGVEDPEAVARLPAFGNRAGGRYGAWSMLFLLPAAALVWSAARVARPVYRESRLRRFRLRRRRVPWAVGCVGLASLLLLVAGFPFQVESFSPVGGDPGDAPFLTLEERVRSLGGVTSWAHPEASAEKTALGVRLVTAPYPEMVPRTEADAFGALPEGVKTLLPAGGLWDAALLAHLAGRRRSAPFALAELDAHEAIGDIDLRILQTVFLARERSHAGVVEALRSGRMYARWTPAAKAPLRLVAWSAGPPSGAAAIAGESVRGEGPLAIRLSIGGGDGGMVTARLIRAGEVIWTTRAAPPFDASVKDDPGGTTYYRLDVEGAYPYRLISNPIFVRRGGATGEGA